MTTSDTGPDPVSYLDGLRTALEAFAGSDRATADKAVAALAVQLRPAEPSPAISVLLQASVFARDGYCCRYCGARTVPVPVLRAVSLLWPKQVPWQRNWRTDATHPIYVTCSATIDHIQAVAHGGSSDSANLATACYACNAEKGEFSLARLGWQLRDVSITDWDGLVGYYPALWMAAEAGAMEADRRYHSRWLAAFDRIRTREGVAVT